MTNFLGGNHIQLLRNGADYFPALKTAIDNAVSSIYLQTYIYEADNAGTLIGNALKQAAQRGVTVNVLLDGFGSKDLSPAFIKKLESAGVQVMFYRPKISPWTFKKNRLRRLHRKVSVIDGAIGFVGGINIIDDYNVPKGMPPRIDYALRIEGSLLPAMLTSVNKLWRRISFIHLQPIVPKTKPVRTLDEALHHEASHGIKAAFVLRDNVLHRRDIENAYLAAITHAHQEIIIANAYFVPGRRFRKALLNAAKRGVKVKLLLQGRMEYFLMFATHAFYGVFLDHGIEIFEYRKGYMHSKVAVIDSEWATVGSSNIDPFSLLLAREANVMVKDKVFASELHEDIRLFIQDNTYQILPKEWSSGYSFKRFISWFAYGIVRFFVGLIGYSKGQ